MPSEKRFDIDPTQIAFISNRKTLIAACDALKLPVIGNGRDKTPASLHGKYSRIRINVNDFDKEPSVFVSFNLNPAEVRRVLSKVRMINMGMKDYAMNWTKRIETDHGVLAEALSIFRRPYVNEAKTETANYPWTVKIQAGGYPDKGLKSKPNYTKTACKLLSDNEIEDFFATAVNYIDKWEIFNTGELLSAIGVVKKEREEERKKYRDSLRSGAGEAPGSGGYSAPPPSSDFDFADEPL